MDLASDRPGGKMSANEFPMADRVVSSLPRTQEAAPRHMVQFYGEDAGLIEGVSAYIGEALEEGNAALVLATAEHRKALAEKLEARGLDLPRAIAEGRCVILDAAEALSKFVLEGWPDPVRYEETVARLVVEVKAAARGNPPRLVVFGEMVALLWARGKFQTAVRLEQLWNELLQRESFSLRCAYPIRGFDRAEHTEAFLAICSEHSHVIPEESYAELTTEDARSRNVSRLQQKAQALDIETAERKDAQKALLRREMELTDFLENALEGVQRSGPDQEILWANRAVLKLLGYEEHEYVGRSFADFFAERSCAEQFWAKLMRGEEVYDHPAELRCKDGSIAYVVIRSNGLWENGSLVYTRTFIHDVSERRAMVEALQKAKEDLETRVRERTDELHRKNTQVLKQAEILDMANQGLRELSARLLRVQDEERRRIARDLHDSTGQNLALLSMNLSALETEAKRLNPNLAKGLEDNAAIVRKISSELRTLSYLLHPPLLEEVGLESALRWYIDGFSERSNIKVALELPQELGRLSRELELATFRVIQECLTNVHRHSGSLTASIRMVRSPSDIYLEVRDEGKGVPPEKLARIAGAGASGVGLRGMKERVKSLDGEFQIHSDEKGTVVRVVIPTGATTAER
jgi:PAS domain S-box-containing protein